MPIAMQIARYSSFFSASNYASFRFFEVDCDFFLLYSLQGVPLQINHKTPPQPAARLYLVVLLASVSRFCSPCCSKDDESHNHTQRVLKQMVARVLPTSTFC
ncbi:uncharacterized protein LOC130932633 [Arachis stenosperma]|uniref:uncharacterized protein LOC130932633 n=1 Tax=Arachis stenosperma TaxID=217475 RepID=UPI0025AC4D71|nr:uncharacterized protein LOC130932633 [Arachis stenosperma]